MSSSSGLRTSASFLALMSDMGTRPDPISAEQKPDTRASKHEKKHLFGPLPWAALAFTGWFPCHGSERASSKTGAAAGEVGASPGIYHSLTGGLDRVRRPDVFGALSFAASRILFAELSGWFGRACAFLELTTRHEPDSLAKQMLGGENLHPPNTSGLRHAQVAIPFSSIGRSLVGLVAIPARTCSQVEYRCGIQDSRSSPRQTSCPWMLAQSLH